MFSHVVKYVFLCEPGEGREPSRQWLTLATTNLCSDMLWLPHTACNTDTTALQHCGYLLLALHRCVPSQHSVTEGKS